MTGQELTAAGRSVGWDAYGASLTSQLLRQTLRLLRSWCGEITAENKADEHTLHIYSLFVLRNAGGTELCCGCTSCQRRLDNVRMNELERQGVYGKDVGMGPPSLPAISR